jgi:hypothetical protein
MSRRRDESSINPMSSGSSEVSVVRLQPPVADYYAYVVDCEEEFTELHGRHLFRIHLLLECISQDWFNDVFARSDFPDCLPPPNQIATASSMRHVDLTVSKGVLDDLVEQNLGRERAHFYEGAWLLLQLNYDVNNRDGIPVTVYLPAEGSGDPSTIGAREVFATVTVLARLAQTTTVRVGLRHFSDVYGCNE